MGRAFVFGDNISTDLIAPGHLLKTAPEVLAKSCLTAVHPDFVKEARPGDILVAGKNFGQGSSREQAVESLKLLGITVLLAKSFARIFYRNSFNLGMPALVFPDADDIREGDDVTVDVRTGTIENKTARKTYRVPSLPTHLLDMMDAGGLIPQLERRLRDQAD